MITAVFIIGGFLFLFVGGESLVRGAVSIARKFGLSEMIIGLTLIGFGTSLPELVTSLEALQEGAVGLSVGNVIGSNVANIMLVLGAAALLAPIVTSPSALYRDGLVVLGASAILLGLLWFDEFTRTAGITMFSLLLVYLVSSIWLDRRAESAAAAMHSEEAEVFEAEDPLWKATLLTLIGIAGVIIGANFLVEGGTTAARALGVSETVIGISILAIGTSLPELVTSMVAARRGKSDVALGNVLGSNIFNILGILGISAIVYPFSVAAPTQTDVPLGVQAMTYSIGESVVTWMDIQALILSLFLIGLFAYTGRRIARWEGLVLLLGYGLYLGLSFDLLPRIGVPF